MAALGGALLAAGTLAVAGGPAAAAPATVTGGTITWGVKTSFRNYVTGPIAHGTITVGSPATGSGPYTFPISAGGTFDGTTGEGSATSTGSVRFQGHGAILDVELADLRVELDGAGGVLVVDAVAKEFIDTETEGAVQTFDDVALASLDLSGVAPSAGSGTVTFTDVPATLTEDGEGAFGGFYAAGEALDPLTLTLDVTSGGTDPDPDPGTGPDGGLTWKISSNVFSTSSSLSAVHELAGGVTETATHTSPGHPNGPDDGFVFPVAAAAYDPDAGADDLLVDVDLSGSVTFGNTNQGNYRIRFADLSVEIDGDGDGRLAAVVSYCTGAGGSSPCAGPHTATPGPITLATITGAIVSTAGDQVVVSATPDYAPQGNSAEPAHRQWDPALVGTFADGFTTGFLSPAIPSMTGHFRDTASGTSTANKAPAPFTLTFGSTASDAVQLTTSLASGPLTISIDGTVIDLGPLALAPGGTAFTTGSMPITVTVTDLRGTPSPWAVQAQVTDFARTGGDGTIPKGGLTWSPSVVAGSTNAPGAAAGGAGAVDGSTLGQADGQGTAVFTAPLTLQAPTTTPAGAYASTLTLTAI